MTQYRNREPDARATNNLELIHCDLTSPVNVIGKGGYEFAITFVDGYSGMVYLPQKLQKIFWLIHHCLGQ